MSVSVGFSCLWPIAFEGGSTHCPSRTSLQWKWGQAYLAILPAAPAFVEIRPESRHLGAQRAEQRRILPSRLHALLISRGARMRRHKWCRMTSTGRATRAGRRVHDVQSSTAYTKLPLARAARVPTYKVHWDTVFGWMGTEVGSTQTPWPAYPVFNPGG